MDRARAAGIVAGHAADRAAGGGGGLHGKEQPVPLQPRIQPLQHHAGLDADRARLRVVIEHPVEMARAIDDEPLPDRLPVLRGAATARDHGYAFLTRDGQRRLEILGRLRHDHAQRHDLVDRGIRGVAPARERVEAHLALHGAPQLALQAEITAGHLRSPFSGDGARRIRIRQSHDRLSL